MTSPVLLFLPSKTQRTVFSLPEQTFDFLEKPEYYFDGFHLNSKRRQRFTETLVTELVGRLRSANSKRACSLRLTAGSGSLPVKQRRLRYRESR